MLGLRSGRTVTAKIRADVRTCGVDIAVSKRPQHMGFATVGWGCSSERVRHVFSGVERKVVV